MKLNSNKELSFNVDNFIIIVIALICIVIASITIVDFLNLLLL